MSLLQTILVALIPVAIIGWRLRRLAGVLRGDGASWKKVLLSIIIVGGIVARISTWAGAPGANASPIADAREVDADEADSIMIQRAADAADLIMKGEEALSRCDTATANYAFQRVAGIGIDMATVDSLAGDPLFIQGVALAGLRDNASASALVTEAARLDRQRQIPENPERATLLQRVTTLARKKC